MENRKFYDLIIIGAGPAGLTASVYASRFGLSNLIVGKLVGGAITEAHRVCNWPTEKEISGSELAKRMHDTALHFGGELMADEVVSVTGQAGDFLIKTSGSEEFRTKAVLIATGTNRRKLAVENESRFVGKGVSYCATCDGPLFKNKIVAVVGGSDSANTASLFLAKVAKKVYQIYRREKLRGDQIWVNQILKEPNIEVVYETNIIGLYGDKKLEKLVLDREYKGAKELLVNGIFVEVGSEPCLENFKSLNLKVNESGYIEVAKNQATNVSGVWAAGDITTGSNGLRQVVTASSEGAVAAESIFEFLQKR